MEIKAYPGIKNAILLCILLLGTQIVLGVIFGLILLLLGIEQSSVTGGIGQVLIFLLTFSLVIFIGFKKTKRTFYDVFKFKNVPLNIWIATIVFMFGLVIISSEIDNLLNFILPMPEFLMGIFQSMMSYDFIIISIILVGILPSFLEEMLFRGVILFGLNENYSQKKAIIVSALLFGLIHLNPYQFVTAFLIGLVSAYICVKTKSILPSIYMHLFNNILVLILSNNRDIIAIKGFNTAHIEHSFQPLWFNCIGIICAGIGVLLFMNCFKKTENA